MPSLPITQDAILNPWKTNNRVTTFLVEHLSPELWEAKLPGVPRRNIGMLAAHIHNARCTWTRTLGGPHGLFVPESVDPRSITPESLVPALQLSSKGILGLLHFGLDQGGSIPPTPAYVWRNLPLDVGHVLSYFVAHEAHHRGQIVMLARQLGFRLPESVTGGLWQWAKLSRQ